jgi:hypothetical protein
MKTILATLALSAALIGSAFATITVSGVIAAYDETTHQITLEGGKVYSVNQEMAMLGTLAKGQHVALDINEGNQEVEMVYTSK